MQGACSANKTVKRSKQNCSHGEVKSRRWMLEGHEDASALVAYDNDDDDDLHGRFDW
jgi:hypothetical protein